MASIGKPTQLNIHCQLIDEHQSIEDIQMSLAAEFDRPQQKHWLQLSGPANLEQLSHILHSYRLHPLVLEDLSSKSQRAKIEEYEDYLFIVLRGSMLTDKQQLKNQLLYLIVAEDFFISYHPKPLLIEGSLQQRLNTAHTPQWAQQSDFNYLLYVHLDCWIDVLMNHVEAFSSKIEKLDALLLQTTEDEDKLPKLHRLKHDSSRLRRSVLPVRDVLNALMRNNYRILPTEQNSWYWRDTYDHCLQLLENLDFSRDILQSMIDLLVNAQTNRMNQQMRLLTALSMVFMPLTVITGIYGMNFDYMPELHWRYGYFVVLAIMLLVCMSALSIFIRRKWL